MLSASNAFLVVAIVAATLLAIRYFLPRQPAPPQTTEVLPSLPPFDPTADEYARLQRESHDLYRRGHEITQAFNAESIALHKVQVELNQQHLAAREETNRILADILEELRKRPL